MLDAIKHATADTAWPNAGTLGWTSISTCNKSLAANGHPPGTNAQANFFTLHMFLMSLAFGFFAPVSSVLYYTLEDTLHLPHDAVKWLHALLQTAAVVCSVLGLIQVYYSNGGPCDYANHFQSLHSYIGITLLAAYWLQAPLAFLVFSNKSLLKPGGTARAAFLKGHVVAGRLMTVVALFVIILGIMAFEVKRPQWRAANSWIGPDYMEIWYKFTRTGVIAFALAVFVALVFAYAPVAAPASVRKRVPEGVVVPEGVQPLVVPSANGLAAAE